MIAKYAASSYCHTQPKLDDLRGESFQLVEVLACSFTEAKSRSLDLKTVPLRTVFFARYDEAYRI
jgi:hypothetical protein